MLNTEEVRASIKEKMRQAYPNQIVEVTAPELSYILCGGDMAGIIAEVEAEINQKQNNAQAEDGLAAAAGYTGNGEETTFPIPSFEEAVKPLMQWIAAHHHPHVKVIVDSSSAELVEGLKSFMTAEFIKD